MRQNGIEMSVEQVKNSHGVTIAYNCDQGLEAAGICLLAILHSAGADRPEQKAMYDTTMKAILTAPAQEIYNLHICLSSIARPEPTPALTRMIETAVIAHFAKQHQINAEEIVVTWDENNLLTASHDDADGEQEYGFTVTSRYDSDADANRTTVEVIPS